MKITGLSVNNMDDWFDFFDNRAFADHPEWKGCYCTEPFLPRFEEYRNTNKKRRDYAKWLIENEKMKGYMAYMDGIVIGWCNANDKILFPRLADREASDESILSVYCLLVEREYRGKGVANEIILHIIADGERKGYDIIEAYPKKKAVSQYGNYHGPYKLFTKNGFVGYDAGERPAVRRYLKK